MTACTHHGQHYGVFTSAVRLVIGCGLMAKMGAFLYNASRVLHLRCRHLADTVIQSDGGIGLND